MSKTVDLNIPRTAAERIAKIQGLRPEYIGSMRAHVDEGAPAVSGNDRLGDAS
jgi:hypothetical protein